ncbi:PREDICTED: pheromone-binding protein Gp-9-like [Dinoponera quadriceps]|uniref:Pheromone-binding protein Gp-9-like n=1 Tax=Dinoponera quadriceps TaxID=609295 RepID=A0A6P3WNF8_DINQU|nr:PREDICTED: pheromone-binding protein Gp-9-like [Dinoponera quadriceps]
MKLTLLFFFTLVASVVTMNEDFDEDFVEFLASVINMTKEETQICVNKSSVTIEDMMHFDQVLTDDLRTIDFDDKLLKIGCLVACICQKKEMMTGAHVNINKLKEMIRPDSKEFASDKLVRDYQVLDKCADYVKNMTDECEVSLKFFMCGHIEMKNRNNNNE